MRVTSRRITEVLGEDYTKQILLMEKTPFKPLYYPGNYPPPPETEKT